MRFEVQAGGATRVVDVRGSAPAYDVSVDGRSRSVDVAGRWIYEAVSTRDYAVIQSGVLMLALIFVLVNLIVDVSYALLNPRIRYS